MNKYAKEWEIQKQKFKILLYLFIKPVNSFVKATWIIRILK